MTMTTLDTKAGAEPQQPAYPEPFASEIANAKRLAIIALEANDPGGAIAHCRALRSALYRADQDAKRFW